ncbi:centrosomal protein of 41 kDa [Entelurus aequoreus]|uniref:centrosomal protein of 41 kDa n=1 Tax=Entelurus aequoreus TaxID=161455 RepID=UPI002B1DADA4|nr:centrosomal protein of 41 kDa [Entelurus aequoreus]XP_061896711.1 centrosomal protein of 41 kDa [Entelurus aequoreus]XP_061896712.1 centrosomal protein of 41 kDa [Entelurus aequoreus]XP_061896713.1 centrosomal protein of 41 kDa [Entelurus aequoreus]XP_061896714.1 centrosomal protein of 41 kDa [Entelurus aequoreus]XP_061896715.1 centrosomal protein of 41 kDa [Entelurus aequoreus]
MSLYRGIGGNKYMTKRIPKNAKYQHIKTKLDTGVSLTKYLERLEDIKKNYKFNRGEIYKRFKVTTFAELILQVASVSDFAECVSGDSSHGLDDGDGVMVAKAEAESNGSPERLGPSGRQDGAQEQDSGQGRSTLLSVINGVGELNMNGDKSKAPDNADPDKPYPDCPYLLLDMRDRDNYDQCHIVSAYSFPMAMLSRTMNPYTKEVLEYKNTDGKIIIVYDEDERIASHGATMMCQRGFENLFLLSGGLKAVAQKFPEGMTTGTLPLSCQPPPAPSKWKKCLASPPPPPSRVADKRWRFTADELTRIEGQLENIAVNSSRTSSRMSTCSSLSKISSVHTSHTSSTSGRDGHVQRPWK